MLPVGFEPTISTGERPQTYVLDRAATGTGYFFTMPTRNSLHYNEVLRFSLRVYNCRRYTVGGSIIVLLRGVLSEIQPFPCDLRNYFA